MIKVKCRAFLSGILITFGSLSSLSVVSQAVEIERQFFADAPGHVFYKDKEGALVKREVILSVPPRGEGELVLSGANWKASTTHFFSYESAGRTVFTAVFIKPAPDHTESSLVLTGTYMRGTNKAVYWGDMYTTKSTIVPQMMAYIKANPAIALSSGFFTHAGGFKFKADIGTDEPTPPAPIEMNSAAEFFIP